MPSTMMARRGWQRWVSPRRAWLGVVVVEHGALFEPQVVAIAVVTVVLEDDDVFRAEAIDDPADDSGFT